MLCPSNRIYVGDRGAHSCTGLVSQENMTWIIMYLASMIFQLFKCASNLDKVYWCRLDLIKIFLNWRRREHRHSRKIPICSLLELIAQNIWKLFQNVLTGLFKCKIIFKDAINSMNASCTSWCGWTAYCQVPHSEISPIKI